MDLPTGIHHHAPRLVYDKVHQRYAIVFVTGDDYLPPKLFGADVADCGNNNASTSQIQVARLSFVAETPVITSVLTVSEAHGGAFRPAFAYSPALQQFLVVWEDRRSAHGDPYLFDVYAQRLDTNLTATGTNFALEVGGSYANLDTSATWTPRPALAAGPTSFLASWFERENLGNVVIWHVNGNIIGASSSLQPTVDLAQATFANTTDTAPTGFLDNAYGPAAQEFLVAISSHTESLWGYYSSVRIQRLSADGKLLAAGGSEQNTVGTGYAVDYDTDDQIAVSVAADTSLKNSTGYLLSYTKHAPNHQTKDFDVWGSYILLPGEPLPPPELSQPQANAILDQLPSFAWKAVDVAVSYQLQVDDNSNFSSPIIDLKISNTTYNANALATAQIIGECGRATLWGSELEQRLESSYRYHASAKAYSEYSPRQVHIHGCHDHLYVEIRRHSHRLSGSDR